MLQAMLVAAIFKGPKQEQRKQENAELK